MFVRRCVCECGSLSSSSSSGSLSSLRSLSSLSSLMSTMSMCGSLGSLQSLSSLEILGKNRKIRGKNRLGVIGGKNKIGTLCPSIILLYRQKIIVSTPFYKKK